MEPPIIETTISDSVRFEVDLGEVSGIMMAITEAVTTTATEDPSTGSLSMRWLVMKSPLS